jgi:hypothetical protein
MKVRLSKLRLLPLAALGCFLVALAGACASNEEKAKEPDPAAALAPQPCGEDEVREFQCEALLPLGPALGAPEPYESCPVTMAIGFSAYPTESKQARFDPRYTDYIRRRTSPGHNCCYSWCSKAKVVDPGKVPPNSGCDSPLAFLESYCLTEPEGGISGAAAAAPYDRCPAAIEPPKASSFSVPSAALLDWKSTGSRRSQGRPECCYAWCSNAPPGSGLERRH